MLTISPEKVCYIIVKAREFDVKEGTTELNEGGHPSGDHFVEILESGSDDPTFQELVGALKGLNRDELLDLVALCWIGRNDFVADEWDEARLEATEMPDGRIHRYLAGTPLLGDYLEDGLNALGYSCEDFEIGRL